MKKTTKMRIAMAMTAVILFLTACESSTGNVGSTGTTEPAVTEAPTPEVVEATEVAEPTEEVVEVTEEPTPEVVEENPNIIDGIDFTKFNNSQESIYEAIDRQATYDTMRIVAVTNQKAVGILKNGDYITQEENESNSGYSFFVYAPKTVVNVEEIIGEKTRFSSQSDLEIDPSSKIIGSCRIKRSETGKDLECGIRVTYEDGSEETIIIYVTKEYVLD